ncbi:SulP family inorganic anion transporter [Serratia ureilytica]
MVSAPPAPCGGADEPGGAVRHGLRAVGHAVCRGIQILIGAFRLGKFIRLVPLPAIHGFVNGLAIVIMLAQLRDDRRAGAADVRPGGAGDCGGGAVPRLTKAIPSSLAALLVVSALAIGLNLHTLRVGDLADISGALPHFSLPTAPFTPEMVRVVLLMRW